jgi:hypothetical protein
VNTKTNFTSGGKTIEAELYNPSATANGGVIVIAYGTDGMTDNLNSPWATMIRDYATKLDVPEFKIVKSSDDIIIANYRVKYHFGKQQRLIDYEIESHFKLQNGKIIEHKDLKSICDFKFALMAVGFPKALLALTPLFRNKVRDSLGKKLKKFMDDFGY